jgi:pyruvate ferredoxin oxidoreductase gamma subunit/2-oxoisovalerate ferredoxin oxidoreductase gamma subunit
MSRANAIEFKIVELIRMQEIRFHGRGGQGTVVAAILLSKAFFQDGFWVQSFPAFGVERRGAPVEAYLRIDKQKVLARYAITQPDHVLVQDCRLIQTVNVTNGLKPGGTVLINTPSEADYVEMFAGFKLATVDATRIASDNGLGTRTHPIVNTAMIGAFARVLGVPPIAAVTTAIQTDIHSKTDANAKAAQEAYETVKLGVS